MYTWLLISKIKKSLELISVINVYLNLLKFQDSLSLRRRKYLCRTIQITHHRLVSQILLSNEIN